ncbi:hypothetical protein RDI58_003376 [Solanum bulbocastanum]|uniref:Uncharacterized protein n=1 Tax=Solanum bulbocastanum TaxID=147425 RepID=A0AAN8YS20_SOLBU
MGRVCTCLMATVNQGFLGNSMLNFGVPTVLLVN